MKPDVDTTIILEELYSCQTKNAIIMALCMSYLFCNTAGNIRGLSPGDVRQRSAELLCLFF